MSYTLLSYITYSLITIYIIIWVGRLFHKNGRVFILSLFAGNEVLTDTTNNLLLAGYYLFNIGYAILQLKSKQEINSISDVINYTAFKSGIQILILALLHYNNMLLIYLFSPLNKNKFTQKL